MAQAGPWVALRKGESSRWLCVASGRYRPAIDGDQVEEKRSAEETNQTVGKGSRKIHGNRSMEMKNRPARRPAGSQTRGEDKGPLSPAHGHWSSFHSRVTVGLDVTGFGITHAVVHT